MFVLIFVLRLLARSIALSVFAASVGDLSNSCSQAPTAAGGSMVCVLLSLRSGRHDFFMTWGVPERLKVTGMRDYQ